MKKLFFAFFVLATLTGRAQYLGTADVANNPPGAYLTFNPTSIVLAPNNAGSQGSSTPVIVGWNQWSNAADTVTPLAGTLISADNVTFISSALIFTTSGTNGTITLYSAMSASNGVGTVTGNLQFKSGTVVTNLPITGTTVGVPTMSVAPTSLTLAANVGTAGSSGTLTTTFQYVSGSISATIPTATIPLELSQDGGTTWASSLSFNSGSPYPIQVRITASATAGSAVDTVQFSGSGVSTIKIPVSCTVTNPSSVHYRMLTIPGASVTANLTNYVMEISDTATSFKGKTQGGSTNNINDLVYCADNAGTTKLKYQIEKWDSVNGIVVAWVNVASITTSGGGSVYVRYNDPTVTTSQSAGNPWDANYSGVFHMNEILTAAGQTVHDATTNGNNYTSVGSWVSTQSIAGIAGAGLKNLSSSSTYLNMTGSAPSFAGDFTMEAWVYLESTPSNTSFLWGATSYANDVNWYSGVGHLYNGGGDLISTISTISVTTWTHIIITRHYDGTNYIYTWYNNGTQDNQTTVAPGASPPGGYIFNFPSLFYNLSSVSLNVRTDEVRFSTTARTGAYAAANYLNQHAPHVFYTLGIEH